MNMMIYSIYFVSLLHSLLQRVARVIASRSVYNKGKDKEKWGDNRQSKLAPRVCVGKCVCVVDHIPLPAKHFYCTKLLFS